MIHKHINQLASLCWLIKLIYNENNMYAVYSDNRFTTADYSHLWNNRPLSLLKICSRFLSAGPKSLMLVAKAGMLSFLIFMQTSITYIFLLSDLNFRTDLQCMVASYFKENWRGADNVESKDRSNKKVTVWFVTKYKYKDETPQTQNHTKILIIHDPRDAEIKLRKLDQSQDGQDRSEHINLPSSEKPHFIQCYQIIKSPNGWASHLLTCRIQHVKWNLPLSLTKVARGDPLFPDISQHRKD